MIQSDFLIATLLDETDNTTVNTTLLSDLQFLFLVPTGNNLVALVSPGYCESDMSAIGCTGGGGMTHRTRDLGLHAERREIR